MNKIALISIGLVFNCFQLAAQNFPTVEGFEFSKLDFTNKGNSYIELIGVVGHEDGYILLTREWDAYGLDISMKSRRESSEIIVASSYNKEFEFQRSKVLSEWCNDLDKITSVYIENGNLHLTWEQHCNHIFMRSIDIYQVSTLNKIAQKEELLVGSNPCYYHIFIDGDTLLVPSYTYPGYDVETNISATDYIQSVKGLDLRENYLSTNMTSFIRTDFKTTNQVWVDIVYNNDYETTIYNDNFEVIGYNIEVFDLYAGKKVKDRILFTNDFILEGLWKSELKKGEKKLSNGKHVGISGLEINWLLSTSDNGFLICSEATSTSHSEQSSYIYKMELILTKIDSEGVVVWNKKVKNRSIVVDRQFGVVNREKDVSYCWVNSENNLIIHRGTGQGSYNMGSTLDKIVIYEDGFFTSDALYTFGEKEKSDYYLFDFNWNNTVVVNTGEKEEVFGLCIYSNKKNFVGKHGFALFRIVKE